MRQFIFIASAIILTTACGNNVKTETTTTPLSTIQATAVADTFNPGIIYQNIKCLNDSSNSFALYIPKNDSIKNKPIVFFFDAHGDPLLPLNNYKKLADDFGYILVGSYNSKNGNDWNTTSQIWSSLFSDISNRLPVNNQRVYTAGFSGGAKVASFIALNNFNISGAIANGAGFPETQQQAPSGNFSFVGIAGTGDMNMTELVSLNNELDNTSLPHQLLLFNGKHEWCPLATMHDAFLFLEFNAVKQKKATVNADLVADFIKVHQQKINKYKIENKLLQYADENKLVATNLNGISSDYVAYESAYSSIIKSPAYQQQLAAYNNLLEVENNMKSNLAGAMQQNTDEIFWKQNVAALNKASKASTENGAMNKRILSYLSLAAYSFSNRALNSGDNETASRYINLYKIIDPENAEAYYFSALVAARNKNTEAAKAELQLAIKKGFTDKQRFINQPEFVGIEVTFK